METLLISFAEADAPIANRIAAVLQAEKYRVILQRPGGERRFDERHRAEVDDAARVIALLSSDYLVDAFCAAQWQSVLASDPLNRASRLVLVRVTECSPVGMLKGLVFWDLVGVTDPAAFERVVRDAAAPPAERSARVISQRAPKPIQATNLPADLSPMVGRSAEIARIGELLAEQRMVTLLGAGGIGKTRTALAVGGLRARAGDTVWFVDLAPLSAGADVVPEVAAVLGIREQHDTPLLATLVGALRTRQLLLILDNCEHLVERVRELADALVHGCPGITILATSRELLSVRGESAYRLPTLAVPPPDVRLGANEALAYDAIALFAARARSADSRFAVHDEDVPVIANICRRLDGIALAIELAAARVATLGLAKIDAKLDERFRLLTNGVRSALPRQQTLRALIDWSYDLLDPAAQQLLRRLSIFAGGWTLDAATAVCGDAEPDEFAMLDGLMSLADKSLVVVDFIGDASRFRYLESTRAYALERARAHENFDELARRRGAFFAAFAGDGSSISVNVLARVAAIERELENLREVLRWALEAGHDVELGARVAVALARFWSTRFPREGLFWLETARSRLEATADRTLLADIAVAVAAMLPHGSAERFTATEDALAATRAIGDPARLAKALAAFGEQLSPLARDVEAHAAFEEALRYAEQIGSDWDAARALAGLTMIAVDRLDIATARSVAERAIALFDGIGAIDGVAYVSIALAEAEYAAGNLRRAVEFAQRARENYGALQNRRSAAGAAVVIAGLALQESRPDAARSAAADALDLLGTDYHPLFFTEAVAQLAHVATCRADNRRGALLYGYTEAARQKTTHVLTGFAAHNRENHRKLLAAALEPAELERCTSEGTRLSDERARAEALKV